jgi:glyoxylase-like metal-dependent hydrolase (beta-lactamase superfamily II)
MDTPVMLTPQTVAPDTWILPAYLPVPGFGSLPVNAFVIRGAEPVLVDTGLAALGNEFMEALESIVDPDALRWIWVTHADADHVGNLARILAAARQARVVTTFLGMGKLAMQGLSLERVHLLNPGQSLELADRRLTAFTPPSFDAPETTGLYDDRSRALFSSDCLGALLEAPVERAADLPEAALREGLVVWATVDAPWLCGLQAGRFAESAAAVRRFEPDAVLSSHLPPARGMLDVLLGHLDAARAASPFVGPDQAELERMMAEAMAA